MPFVLPVMELTMLERRQIPRTRIRKHARLIFDQPPLLLDCTALDVTNVGASLRIAASLDIPERFDLAFASTLASRNCRLVWRTEDILGVSYKPMSCMLPLVGLNDGGRVMAYYETSREEQ
jgi:hypothetical protein